MSEAASPRPDLIALLPDELALFLRGLGQPAYRTRQVFAWLQRGASFAQMTDLPLPLRERMAQLAAAGTLAVAQQETAPDAAARFAFRTADGHLVESVLIPHPNRVTVCVSSQIGCAMACSFCATGQQGLVRSLSAGEIVEQVVQIQRTAAPARVSNVVFMGMGEPLANYEAVVRAVRLLNHPWGLRLGARHIAISTCGLPQQIRRLAQEAIQVALAISLHGATDEVRSRLVPVNLTHPIGEVIAAAGHYARVTGRKVAFQYVIVPGLNDTPEQAQQLARLVRGMPSMVNLIPRNPIRPEERFDPQPAYAFAARLRGLGVAVAVRRSRGAEVLGACGQLRDRMRGEQRERS